MTTPDQHSPHSQATGPAQDVGTANPPLDSPGGQVQFPTATPMESDVHAPGPSATTMDSSGRHSEAPVATTMDAGAQTELPAQSTDSGTEESLFGDLLSGLRSRWDDVQASFVDDPRQCVQKADRLVSDVVDRLTEGFTQARSRLEEQWARGEEASTEDLRQALKRYRDFFHRLLSVQDTEAEHRGP